MAAFKHVNVYSPSVSYGSVPNRWQYPSWVEYKQYGACENIFFFFNPLKWRHLFYWKSIAFYKEKCSYVMITKIYFSYLDSMHKRIVAILQKQLAKLLQEETNTQCRPPCQVGILHGHAVLSSFLWVLLSIKWDVLCILRGLVVDNISFWYGLEILHIECASKSGMSVGREVYWMCHVYNTCLKLWKNSFEPVLFSTVKQMQKIKMKVILYKLIWPYQFCSVTKVKNTSTKLYCSEIFASAFCGSSKNFDSLTHCTQVRCKNRINCLFVVMKAKSKTDYLFYTLNTQ